MQYALRTIVFASVSLAANGCVLEALSNGASQRVGDVTVTTQAEADALACVTRIVGSLTVRPAEPIVTLPALEEVTGDVLIEIEDIPAVDQDMFLTAERADLPALQSVGGTLSVHHLDGNYETDVQIGLPMLTSLPGDLDLVLSSFNGYNKGLPALTTVAGNVSIQATGDFYPFGLLEALTNVTGDLTIHSNAGSSGGILPGLQSVGGDVELSALGRQNSNTLVSLQSVGGNFSVLNSYWGPSHYSALASVNGTFKVDGGSGGSPLPYASVAGSATLTLGGLDLHDTAFSSIPLASGTRVTATGPITVEDNPSLCQAAVDAFVSEQMDSGWTGSLSVSGNAGSCMP